MVGTANRRQSILDAVARLAPHDHACLIYETQEEQFGVIVPFVRCGLERNERCIYIADDNSPSVVAAALQTGGIDVAQALARKALVILSKHDAYLQDGGFTPEHMLEMLVAAAKSASQDGFAALRITGEMTWALGKDPDAERLIEYEARVNECFEHANCLAICQYNRKRFPPETILDVIRTHPLVIHGGRVCRNFHYIPPDEFLGRSAAEHTVDRLLESIRTREKAEEALCESKARFEAIADYTYDFEAWIDGNGRLAWINPAVERFTGRTPEECRADPGFPLSVVHEDDRPRMAKVFAEAACQITGNDIEFRLLRKDGSSLWAAVSWQAIRDRNGKPMGQRLSVRDISDRKRAEEASLEARAELEQLVGERTAELRAANEHFAALARVAPVGIFQTDRDGDCLYVNEAWCRISGLSSAEAMGTGWVQGIHPEDRARVSEKWYRAARERTPFKAEYRFRSPDGRCTWVIGQATEECDGNGRVRGFVGTITDITDRKDAEERLRASEHWLRTSERLASIGTLAAGIAHEINNPVGMIMIAAENALECRHEPDAALRMEASLRAIVEDSTRCGRIVQGVLQFARNEPTEKWVGDFNACVQRAVGATEHYGAARDVGIKMKLATNLPPVLLNSIEIEQVVVNLVRNAIEASKAGTAVAVSTEPTPDGVSLVVEDMGRGMTEEQSKHLFDPFYTTRRGEGGTGLGMSIVHGIVSSHEGTVDVESDVGRGTRVCVNLPAATRPAEGGA